MPHIISSESPFGDYLRQRIVPPALSEVTAEGSHLHNTRIIDIPLQSTLSTTKDSTNVTRNAVSNQQQIFFSSTTTLCFIMSVIVIIFVFHSVLIDVFIRIATISFLIYSFSKVIAVICRKYLMQQTLSIDNALQQISSSMKRGIKVIGEYELVACGYLASERIAAISRLEDSRGADPTHMIELRRVLCSSAAAVCCHVHTSAANVEYRPSNTTMVLQHSVCRLSSLQHHLNQIIAARACIATACNNAYHYYPLPCIYAAMQIRHLTFVVQRVTHVIDTEIKKNKNYHVKHTHAEKNFNGTSHTQLNTLEMLLRTALLHSRMMHSLSATHTQRMSNLLAACTLEWQNVCEQQCVCEDETRKTTSSKNILIPEENNSIPICDLTSIDTQQKVDEIFEGVSENVHKNSEETSMKIEQILPISNVCEVRSTSSALLELKEVLAQRNYSSNISVVDECKVVQAVLPAIPMKLRKIEKCAPSSSIQCEQTSAVNAVFRELTSRPVSNIPIVEAISTCK